jgi:hypothetical protein
VAVFVAGGVSVSVTAGVLVKVGLAAGTPGPEGEFLPPQAENKPQDPSTRAPRTHPMDLFDFTGFILDIP